MEVSVRCGECNVDQDQQQENMVCFDCHELLKDEYKLLEKTVEALEDEIESLTKELQEKD